MKRSTSLLEITVTGRPMCSMHCIIRLDRSYLGSTDSQNITHGESMALIKANLERKGGDHSLDIGLKKGRRKRSCRWKRSGKVSGLSVVTGSDDSTMDQDLILDAENHRKLVDATIIQNSRVISMP